MKEGLARTDEDGTKTNDLALDIAIIQCRHLFILDIYDSYYSRADGIGPKKEFLMNLLLFPGEYQELYDICCYYSRNGEKLFTIFIKLSWAGWLHKLHRMEGGGHYQVILPQQLSSSWKLSRTTLNHMYILKHMLHQTMEILPIKREGGKLKNQYLICFVLRLHQAEFSKQKHTSTAKL